MIPIHLHLSGFLSYRDPVELDFTSFDLACISGPNGAGKSSLLDAITWSLFGQARKRDESLINSHPEVEAAEVIFIFAYEGNVYRVQRANPRGKTSSLEFHIGQNYAAGEENTALDDIQWKQLTGHSLRATQAMIEATLRMDFETFVNASFFLQGKADLFTQQRPGDRKRILGSILGLEIWETYRQRASDQRKSVEGQIAALDGRLAEINAELAEEKTRRARLGELEAELERTAAARRTQEASLETIRKLAATLNEQRRWVTGLARQLEATEKQLQAGRERLVQRQAEQGELEATSARAGAIQADYHAWQEAQKELARWEEVAQRFRSEEKRRQEPLDEINAARARLEQELTQLEKHQAEVEAQTGELPAHQAELDQAHQAAAEVEARLAERSRLREELDGATQEQAEAKAENPRLKAEMYELRERIDHLSVAAGAECPLCGQPLEPQDRELLIESLEKTGLELKQRYLDNQELMKQTWERVSALQKQIGALSQAEKALQQHQQAHARLEARLEQIAAGQNEWKQNGGPRLEQVRAALADETYAPEARAALAEIDAELQAIGYDSPAHDAARRTEAGKRSAQEQLRELEKAQAALAPLAREIQELGARLEELEGIKSEQEKAHSEAAARLAAAEAEAPDLQTAERELLRVQEGENRLRMEVGAARQKVAVLEDLRQRRATLDEERQELARLVGRYRQLERAFGKDGVPALLIEQALPQIEARANEVLDRLSGGSMSVRFLTQAAYKDTRRQDLRETLEIQISDSAGLRDYEMFSGGEAFRVNFAIRLALAEVLSQRAGARLQTLVIDEGFGSQDAQGRQRLIEAINLVQEDFAKVLVITHIDELKEIFPTRIEVDKTPRGSRLQVL